MLPTGGSVHRPQAAHLTAATKGVHVAASGGNASQVAISRAGNHGNQAPYSSGIGAGTDEPQDARLHTAELATRSLAMGPRSGVAQAAWMQDARGSMSAAVQQVAQLKAELACVAGENASLSAELTGLRDARMVSIKSYGMFSSRSASCLLWHVPTWTALHGMHVHMLKAVLQYRTLRVNKQDPEATMHQL